MTLLIVALGAIFFAGMAMTVNEGLWNNTVSLLCIMLGGLLAVVAGVPLGMMGIEQAGSDDSFAWYFVFAGMWLVFALATTLFRVATDRASRTRLRFIPLVDKIVGPLMGLFVAVMLTSFTAYTLERVPINAGRWKLVDASETQRSILTWARAPFLNVANRFVQAEGIETPLVAK